MAQSLKNILKDRISYICAKMNNSVKILMKYWYLKKLNAFFSPESDTQLSFDFLVANEIKTVLGES